MLLKFVKSNELCVLGFQRSKKGRAKEMIGKERDTCIIYSWKYPILVFCFSVCIEHVWVMLRGYSYIWIQKYTPFSVQRTIWDSRAQTLVGMYKTSVLPLSYLSLASLRVFLFFSLTSRLFFYSHSKENKTSTYYFSEFENTKAIVWILRMEWY